MTKTGMMIGSLGFMAPEQISGRPGPEADIFAWGVTVAYAATGRSPFGAGNSHSILYRVMYGDPDIASVPDSLLPLVEAVPGQGAAEPADRAAVAGPADERLPPPRERQRHAHPGDPGADLAERIPSERAAGQQASRAEPGSSPPARARSLAACRTVARRTVAVRTVAAAPPTETPTADQAAPVLSRGAVPSAMAPAAAAPGSEKIPVGRRMATIATSALVAMRLRRPSRREEPKR